jgi:hypothetical protein
MLVMLSCSLLLVFVFSDGCEHCSGARSASSRRMRVWSSRISKGVIGCFLFCRLNVSVQVMELELGSGPKKNQVIKKKGSERK